MKRLFTGSLLVFFLVLGAGGQTTAFNYQGSLSVSGVPANGNYDFLFMLFSDASGGSPIGLGVGVNNVPVTNGSFSVILNFQNQFPGAIRFLEIRVRPAGEGTHTTLTPRQLITSSPYSVKSINAENALQLGGIASTQYVLTGDSRLTDARSPLPNSANYIQNRATPQASSNFNVSGHGTVGGSLTAGENSFFEKAVSIGTSLTVGASASVGASLTVGSNVNAGAISTTGGVTVGTNLHAGSISTSGGATVGTTLNAAAINTTGSATIGSTINAGAISTTGSATVGSNLSAAGVVNTGSQFNVGGNFALSRSRLDLFNTAAVPDGYSFQALNSPNFLVLKNDAGSTLLTIAQDGKVGIGDNNPTEATLEIGGTLAVSNLGGSDGEQLCRDGNLIRACSVTRSAVPGPQAGREKLVELESTIRRQQIEIERQRDELAALKSFICVQNPTAAMCGPKQ